MDFETFRENLARDIKRNIDAILGDELKKYQQREEQAPTK